MTPQNQIKALAELDGWTNVISEDVGICGFPNGKPTGPLGCGLDLVIDYLTSYDAIIPLIQKQSVDVKLAIDRECFEAGLLNSFEAKPDFLCEALLRATGKWNRQ